MDNLEQWLRSIVTKGFVVRIGARMQGHDIRYVARNGADGIKGEGETVLEAVQELHKELQRFPYPPATPT